MVLKKSKNDTNVLFIDASNEYVKVTNNNKLTPDNIQNIVKAYKDRIDKDYMVKVASYEDVKNNDYNLSVSTYVVKEDTREKIDIKKLNAEIEEIVARENILREEIDKIIKEIEHE
jgi:type I restriction enzyme M protein